MYIKNKIRLYTFFLVMSLFFLLINSCKKKTEALTVPEKGTVTDIEGTVYATIKIGHQWWMTENLKVTKYNDGTPITEVRPNASIGNPDTAWLNNKTGAWSIHSNSQNNLPLLGRLYNWYAVNSGKLAPPGWHVPSDDEWKELEYHLGMSLADIDKTSWRGSDEGNKLKKEGVALSTAGGWYYSTGELKFSVWGTNESGFTALGGSCCMFDGIWGNPGTFFTGFWWTATPHSGNEAWYRHLDYKKTNVFRYYGPNTYGFSVRCVKD